MTANDGNADSLVTISQFFTEWRKNELSRLQSAAEQKRDHADSNRAQWLKCNGTLENAVSPPPIYGSKRSPTSDCYNARKRHMTTDRRPKPECAVPPPQILHFTDRAAKFAWYLLSLDPVTCCLCSVGLFVQIQSSSTHCRYQIHDLVPLWLEKSLIFERLFNLVP